MDHALYLLRHGETEWSATGRHTGRTDLPLTAAGEDQARAAGRTYAHMRDQRSVPLVLSSPRERALRTAELAGLRIDEKTEELAEWDYGDYEGLTTDRIRETVPGWTVWSHAVPGGESAAQVAARADTLLPRVRQTLAHADVVLVGHGHFSRVLVARWLGLDVTAGVHFKLGPAGLTVLGDERGEPRIDHLNIPPSQEAP
ncbi:acid phosphatase [Qaidamihabitans albus]|uniref:acid phosphatase n=1 Tax=Qaidamihabitans albus TaxID=2795733 RepID=UPI0018F1C5D6|nr:acid phosphatase [Qaidamihabitans albus]